MSGSFAALAVGGFSLAADALSLDQSVSLGDFVFDGWEVPENIQWGGDQRITVHKIVGGNRVIDVMGRDDSDITWSGIILSPDASTRADQLDQMRIAGEVQELIFAGRYYKVVVSHFRADQRKPWQVPYNITCSVLSDQSAVGSEDPTSLSQVIGDIIAAEQFVSDGMSASLAAAAIVGALVGSVTSIQSGTDQERAIEQALADTNAAIQARQVEVSNRIAALTAATAAGDPVAAAATVDVGIANLQDAATAAQDAALAAAMAGYIQRAQVNVGAA